MEDIKCRHVGNDTFIGEFKHVFEFTGAYGGENVAMAAKAALMSIEPADRYLINSVHCYYLRPGRKGQVCYHVNRVKDGQRFCFRNVVGIQEDKPIITCMVSFKSSNNGDKDQSNDKYFNSLTKQEMDEALSALSCSSSSAIFDFDVAHHIKDYISMDVKHWKAMPFWYMSTTTDESKTASQEPKQCTWIKPRRPLSSAADQNDHRLALIYASDYHVNQTILYKHPQHQFNFQTSIDHAVQFCSSSDVDFNEWHLCHMECDSFDSGLTSNRSRIYTRYGDLIACITQQGYLETKAKL